MAVQPPRRPLPPRRSNLAAGGAAAASAVAAVATNPAAASTYALIIDYKYCTGCHSCEVACRNEKQIKSQDEWGIKIAEFGPERLDGNWYWDYVAVPSTLCDLCMERIEAGKKPACAHHCLAKCMEAVPLSEVPAKVLELGGEGVGVFLPQRI